MILTPEERRAVLAIAGLLLLGLLARWIVPAELPPRGGGDSLLVSLAPSDSLDHDDPPPGLELEGRIRINEATREQIELLPGIGPKLAGRILDSRARDGPFRSAADLERVAGIGPRSARRLGPLVSFAVAAPGAPADCTKIGQDATPADGPPGGRGGENAAR